MTEKIPKNLSFEDLQKAYLRQIGENPENLEKKGENTQNLEKKPHNLGQNLPIDPNEKFPDPENLKNGVRKIHVKVTNM